MFERRGRDQWYQVEGYQLIILVFTFVSSSFSYECPNTLKSGKCSKIYYTS